MTIARSRDSADAEARERFRQEAGKEVLEVKHEHRKEIAERIEPVIGKWTAERKASGIDGAALLARARALVAANGKR
jgi:chorismate mutase